MQDDRKKKLALILDHAQVIRKLAEENGFEFIAYLLDMVVEEARSKMADGKKSTSREKELQTSR